MALTKALTKEEKERYLRILAEEKKITIILTTNQLKLIVFLLEHKNEFDHEEKYEDDIEFIVEEIK